MDLNFTPEEEAFRNEVRSFLAEKLPARASLVRRVPARLTEMPLRKTNNGAQKCVIHRVRNNSGVVVARSVGLGLNA